MAWMRLPEVPLPMQLTDAGSAPWPDDAVACSRPARPRRRASGLRRLLRASSSLREGRLYRLTPCGGASFPCRQATMAPARRSRQAAAGSVARAASGGLAAGPVEATRATPTIRATTVAVAIVRPRRAGSRRPPHARCPSLPDRGIRRSAEAAPVRAASTARSRLVTCIDIAPIAAQHGRSLVLLDRTAPFPGLAPTPWSSDRPGRKAGHALTTGLAEPWHDMCLSDPPIRSPILLGMS
jgi:hypothetical protein